jgi:beta-glucosidase
MTEEPMFTFGFALTYSKTIFDNTVLNTMVLSKGDELTVKVQVANIGTYDIEEVVVLHHSIKADS